MSSLKLNMKYVAKYNLLDYQTWGLESMIDPQIFSSKHFELHILKKKYCSLYFIKYIRLITRYSSEGNDNRDNM